MLGRRGSGATQLRALLSGCQKGALPAVQLHAFPTADAASMATAAFPLPSQPRFRLTLLLEVIRLGSLRWGSAPR